jgi:hypothetical protein
MALRELSSSALKALNTRRWGGSSTSGKTVRTELARGSHLNLVNGPVNNWWTGTCAGQPLRATINRNTICPLEVDHPAQRPFRLLVHRWRLVTNGAGHGLRWEADLDRGFTCGHSITKVLVPGCSKSNFPSAMRAVTPIKKTGVRCSTVSLSLSSGNGPEVPLSQYICS